MAFAGQAGWVVNITSLFVATSILTCLLMIPFCRLVRLGSRKKSVLREPLIGELGEAQMSLAPEGFVTVRCRTYRACSTAPISAGDPICVIGIGKILTVEPYVR